MNYVALVSATALQRVQVIVGPHGSVSGVSTVDALLRAMRSADDGCIVVDPTMLDRAGTEAIVAAFRDMPRSIVVYAPIAREALEPSVTLAQQTAAQFVFHGAPNERSALGHALLLAPDAALGVALTAALDPLLVQLPHQLRLTLASMLRTGTGPATGEALAAHAGVARRSMDRALAAAGLESSRFLIAAARLVRVYRAIVASRLPFRQIAAMAGYASQRTLDHHCTTFFGHSSARLRRHPPSVAVAVQKLTEHLTLGTAVTSDRHVHSGSAAS